MNKIIATIVSFFFPGIGQALQGEVKLGIIIFIVYLILSYLLSFVLNLGTIATVILLIICIAAAYHTYTLPEN